MKKISILIILIGLLSFISCKKDETKATLSSTASAPVLNLAAGDSIVLLKANADSLMTYSWSAAGFGQQLVVTYTLEMDKSDSNFSNPVALGTTTNVTRLSILTSDLNNKLLLAMELNPAATAPLHISFRVKATVSANVKPVYSAGVRQTLTPYYVVIVYPLLFVPGNYEGWTPGDSNFAIASLKSDSKYEGYIWFSLDSTQFKYDQGGNWTTNWGDDGQDGTLNPNGANIIAVGKGYYKLNVNLTSLTHTFLKTSWGLIGDATPGGWNTDSDMAYDSIARVWTVTLDLSAASIKFRANHDWTWNFGDDGADGILDYNGANIAVPAAGNYTVTMDIGHPPVYKYHMVKN